MYDNSVKGKHSFTAILYKVFNPKLSLFMVNVSQLLMCSFRQFDPDFSVLDLKAYFRGCKYGTELLKLLPQKPNAIFVSQLFRKIATLGSIHTVMPPISAG